MFKRIACALWGDFESRQELQKFGFLAAIFFLIICTYWALRPIKDTLFFAIIGREYLWAAKIVSLLVLSPFIVIYGKMVTLYDHHKIFYILICCYIIGALGFMCCFMHPEIGLANTIKGSDRLIGWAWYVFVESFGSLLVTLFWAFAADTTMPDSARRGFPLIALFGQLGNIFGPTFITAKYWGFATSGPVIGVCALLMGITGIVFWIFIQVTEKEQLRGYQVPGEELIVRKQEAGFFEGLRILVTEKYLLSMFAVIMLYEILITVFDYHFKQGVGEMFPLEVEASAYLASYAQYVGVVSTLCILFGINNIQRHLGMKIPLILLPFLVLSASCAVYLYPSAINVAFWIMVFSKAVNYALNQPTMKQLYIPTTPDVKYKAQAWIEMFGSRGSKSVASLLNGLRNGLGVPMFIALFSVGSVGLVGIWVFIALYIAKTYDAAIAHKRVIC